MADTTADPDRLLDLLADVYPYAVEVVSSIRQGLPPDLANTIDFSAVDRVEQTLRSAGRLPKEGKPDGEPA